MTIRRKHFNKAMIKFLLNQYECQTCGETGCLTLDHIIPLYYDGADNVGNLQILCKECNEIKERRILNDKKIGENFTTILNLAEKIYYNEAPMRYIRRVVASAFSIDSVERTAKSFCSMQYRDIDFYYIFKDDLPKLYEFLNVYRLPGLKLKYALAHHTALLRYYYPVEHSFARPYAPAFDIPRAILIKDLNWRYK